MPESAQTNSTDRLEISRISMRYARAFTLTELLIVIGIIVLFITLALPAFNLISGGKSIAGAENELSALLGRAHSEAIGVQDYRGLAIYRDAATDRYCGAIITFVTYSTWNPNTTYQQYQYVTNVIGTGSTAVTHYYVYASSTPLVGSAGNAAPTNSSPPSPWSECGPNAMDIESDTDIQTFPAGVGVQVMNNWPLTNGTPPIRQSNGYLPMGVILFDANGVMKLFTSVSFAEYGHLGATANFQVYKQGSIPYYIPSTPPPGPMGLQLSSAIGLVAFDKQAFEGQNFYSGLPSQLTSQSQTGQNNGSGTSYIGYATPNPGEQAADTWLDANATPLLVNRYNGTLVRSE